LPDLVIVWYVKEDGGGREREREREKERQYQKK
jgi:hypothetical protein